MPKKIKRPIIVDPRHELLKILEEENRCPDIIKFSEDYLKLNLHPAQRFVLKCFYNLELDTKSRNIRVPDKFNSKTLYKMTEKEYLSFLYNEGRTNVKFVDQILSPEMILVAGRRGGKTFICGDISSYEAYKVVYGFTDKKKYGLKDDSRIEIQCISSSKEQSENLYFEIRGNVTRSRCFFSSIDRNPEDHMYLRTKKDKEIFGNDGLSTLRVGLTGATARTVRGKTNIVAILDELAYFINKDSSRSCRQMYDAVTPSVANFGNDGRIVSISSAGGKEGKFYDLYKDSLKSNNEHLLMFKLPTWYLNPTIPGDYLRRRYKSDPIMYMVEYGAEFSERVFGWMEKESDITDCIDKTFPMLTQGKPAKRYFLGIDYGAKNNSTGVALVDRDDDKAILIYSKEYTAKKGRFAGYKKIMPSDVAVLIEELKDKFRIRKGLADSFNALGLEDAMNNLNLDDLIEFKMFNPRLKAMMWKFWRNLIIERRFILYKEAKRDKLVPEILSLQRRIVSKDIVLVESPQSKSSGHADRSDAIVRAIWLAFNDKEVQEEHKKIIVTSTRISKRKYQTHKAKRSHTGKLTVTKNLDYKHKRRK